METTLYEVNFYDGRKFNVFCQGKAQKKRFFDFTQKHKEEINCYHEVTNGIHTIRDFEKITTNKL